MKIVQVALNCGEGEDASLDTLYALTDTGDIFRMFNADQCQPDTNPRHWTKLPPLPGNNRPEPED